MKPLRMQKPAKYSKEKDEKKTRAREKQQRCSYYWEHAQHSFPSSVNPLYIKL